MPASNNTLNSDEPDLDTSECAFQEDFGAEAYYTSNVFIAKFFADASAPYVTYFGADSNSAATGIKGSSD